MQSEINNLETTKIVTGEQTQITPKVREVANTLKGEGAVLVEEIFNYIKSMSVVKNSTEPDFTRTAEQILEDGRWNGCNEAGVVFATILRAKGIPTTYIQALKKTAVGSYSANNPVLHGHVFLEVSLGDGDKNKKIINSTTGEITNELPSGMVLGRKGLDSWDIGLKKGFDDLKELFEEISVLV